VLQTLDLPGKAYFAFEIDLDRLSPPTTHRYQEVSRFPEIRRDIALLVNQTVPAKAIQDTIKMIAGDWLKDVFIFDVYQGKGISPGLKSIAAGLIWQHPARTLVDDEVTDMMANVISALKRQLGAELRS
jgi:phenylalanyl-tRNA synthetase beta chain